jgi:hypothetical protein
MFVIFTTTDTAHSVGVSFLLEHIFKKMGSTEIVMSSVRLSVCPSVTYFSAVIAPRELKFSTEVRWCLRLNSTVQNFGSVA